MREINTIAVPEREKRYQKKVNKRKILAVSTRRNKLNARRFIMEGKKRKKVQPEGNKHHSSIRKRKENERKVNKRKKTSNINKEENYNAIRRFINFWKKGKRREDAIDRGTKKNRKITERKK